MNTETIDTCYQPVRQYWQAIEFALDETPTPPFALRGLDVFLMRQIAAYYPIKLQVIDLAAEHTFGASSVAWATPNTPVARVFTPYVAGQNTWTTWLAQHLRHWEHEANCQSPVELMEDATLEQLVERAKSEPMLGVSVIAILPENASVNERAALLKTWLTAYPKAILFTLPFGKVGEDENVQLALEACKVHSEFTFRLGREISAMFGSSQLGIFYPKHNTHLPSIFDRLHTLYEGNFNFANLLNDNTSLRLRIQRLEAQISHYEQIIQQQSQQIASHQATQQGLEAQLAALVNAPPPPQQLMSPPQPLPPLDGFHVPSPQTALDRLRLRLSSLARALQAKWLARLFYPRRLSAYKAQILGCSVPQAMVAGNTYEGLLIVLNAGKGTWYPQYRTPHCVNVSYHWLDRRGRMLIKEGERTALPHEIAPGERVTVTFRIVAPSVPGSYRLQVDLVHEGVRWLGDLYNFPSYPVEVTLR
jgi:uncharacterized coiled-coil protein SlyX